MRISDYDLESLRYKVEHEGGFEIAITPVFPLLFEGVGKEADVLHDKIVQAGYEVLMDDRNRKPRDMFEVVDFLRIPHRLTISGRSLVAGVYEYWNLETGYHEKVKREQVLDFLDQMTG